MSKSKQSVAYSYPDVNALVDWEEGRLDDESERTLFQGLVNSGLAWQLQGMYGRHAAALLRAGEIQPAGRVQ